MGAFPEIVDVSGGGLIYSPNTPEKLSESWAELLNNPEKLEKQSLIRRRRNPGDERSVLIHLTVQGRLLKHQAAHIPEAIEATIRLTDEESKTVRHLLDRFQADAL